MKQEKMTETMLNQDEIGNELFPIKEEKNTSKDKDVWRIVKDGVVKEYDIASATEDELRSWHYHALSMIWSNGEKKGRYVIREKVVKMRRECVAEMFARWLEIEKGWDRRQCFDDIRGVIARNEAHLTKEEMENLTVLDIMSGVPDKYKDVKVEDLLNAVTYSLGTFDPSLISRSFIIGLGVYLTKDEMENLLEKDEEGNTVNRMEVIKKRLKLSKTCQLKYKENGLTYDELQKMLNLSKIRRYDKMPTLTLQCLIMKVLPRLILRLDKQVLEWEERATHLEEVMERRGVVLDKGEEMERIVNKEGKGDEA